MLKKTHILPYQSSQLNAAVLMTLITPLIFRDFILQKDHVHCFFSQSISNLQIMIKTFLATLYELTSKYFYFEVLNDHEAILKIYSAEPLQFSQELLFNSSFTSQGSNNQ